MIGDIIRDLRTTNSLTQAELGKKMGVIKQTISNWEKNVSTPNIDAIIELAKIFDVPTDYLLGKSDDRNTRKTESVQNGYFFFFFDECLRDTFKSRFETSLENKNMSIKNFSEVSEIKLDICKDYLEGMSEPSLEDLVQIASVLEVSIDYLLGKTDASVSTLSEDEEELLEYYNKLSKMNKRWVLGQIVDLLKKQDEAVNKSVAEDEEPLRKASGK